MPYGLTMLKLEDFGKWKSAFDEHDGVRKEAGEKSFQVFQTEGDPNNVMVLIEWDNPDNARKFMQAPDMGEIMKKAGVIGMPETHFLEEVDRGSA